MPNRSLVNEDLMEFRSLPKVKQCVEGTPAALGDSPLRLLQEVLHGLDLLEVTGHVCGQHHLHHQRPQLSEHRESHTRSREPQPQEHSQVVHNHNHDPILNALRKRFDTREPYACVSVM